MLILILIPIFVIFILKNYMAKIMNSKSTLYTYSLFLIFSDPVKYMGWYKGVPSM